MPSRFANQIRQVLRSHQIPDTEALLLAVSGGADSVALFRALAEWSPERLMVVYVDHQLRPEARAESEFVGAMARGSRAAFSSVEIPTKKIQGENQRGVEEAARVGRYKALAEIAREKKLAYVLTGHTANDQAETVLWRLLRGGALASLQGMQEIRPLVEGVSLVRPMLGIQRGALLRYLQSREQSFVLDASNETMQFTRNRLRNQVMPLLEKENPEVVRAFAEIAKEARQAEELLEGLTQESKGRVLLERVEGRVVLSVRAMLREKLVLQGRLLRSFLPERYMSRGQLESLLRLMSSEGGASVVVGVVTATRQKDELVLQWALPRR